MSVVVKSILSVIAVGEHRTGLLASLLVVTVYARLSLGTVGGTGRVIVVNVVSVNVAVNGAVVVTAKITDDTVVSAHLVRGKVADFVTVCARVPVIILVIGPLALPLVSAVETIFVYCNAVVREVSDGKGKSVAVKKDRRVLNNRAVAVIVYVNKVEVIDVLCGNNRGVKVLNGYSKHCAVKLADALGCKEHFTVNTGKSYVISRKNRVGNSADNGVLAFSRYSLADNVNSVYLINEVSKGLNVTVRTLFAVLRTEVRRLGIVVYPPVNATGVNAGLDVVMVNVFTVCHLDGGNVCKIGTVVNRSGIAIAVVSGDYVSRKSRKGERVALEVVLKSVSTALIGFGKRIEAAECCV